LLTSPQVAAVAASNAVPFDLFNSSNNTVHLEGETQQFAAHIVNIGAEFPSLYGMRLLTGRLLSAAYGEDVLGHNVLINSQVVRRSGHTAQELIGKTVAIGKDRPKIIGVLADAKLDGMKESVVPTIYLVTHERFTLLSVRVHGGRIADALTYIDKTWRSFAPSVAIQPYFLSDAFDKLFAADEKQGTMFGLFVGVAIFIACLGLFGLAVFTAQRRTKEIGVRKIFGASTADIVRLLLRQISIPVLIANAIAWPITYYYLKHWLDGYAYRISLNPLYFLTAGVVALAIAWATVFAHAVRLARADPIHALRYE
jgi:putative ABC transport system permease protein